MKKSLLLASMLAALALAACNKPSDQAAAPASDAAAASAPAADAASAPAAAASDAPRSAPYPVQRGLTQAMREAGVKAGDVDRMQMWAGQSAKFARSEPAGTIVQELWEEASRLLI